jgi:hypothetical protein
MGKLVMGAGLPTWSSLPMYGFTSSISKQIASLIGSVARSQTNDKMDEITRNEILRNEHSTLDLNWRRFFGETFVSITKPKKVTSRDGEWISTTKKRRKKWNEKVNKEKMTGVGKKIVENGTGGGGGIWARGWCPGSELHALISDLNLSTGREHHRKGMKRRWHVSVVPWHHADAASNQQPATLILWTIVAPARASHCSGAFLRLRPLHCRPWAGRSCRRPIAVGG